MAQARRTTSRNSLLAENETNRSNNNVAGIRRTSSSEKENWNLNKQNSTSSLKILGQDDEVSDVLWNGTLTDRNTPTPSQQGSHPGCLRRTPTPSKHISLQAVKRKEEKIEPLEPFDWNDMDKQEGLDDRLPRIPISDSDSDFISPRDMPFSPEERLALVEQRTQQMTSALSSVCMNENETDLSRQLDLIDTAREEKDMREKEDFERQSKKPDQLTVEDGQFTYRNDHFRDLSERDHRDKIDTDFILDRMVEANINDEIFKVGTQPQKQKGENLIGRHAMDKIQETAVGAVEETQAVKQSESNKKDEASAETSSGGDDSDDEDEDLIGEKGKAPNALLMEFLTCMMQEDYENAEKLCKMILIYEPENPEAVSFFPLIQQKIQQEEEEEEDSSDESDDSGEEGDSDDDDDDDDDDDNDDEENSSEDSDDDGSTHPDSGIASANSASANNSD